MTYFNSAFKNIAGHKINKLLVIERVESRGKIVRWLCECECGKRKIISAPSLNQRKVKSCGCALRDALLLRNTMHGMSGTKAHVAWTEMMKRCYDKNLPAYKNYGERGITVCEKWKVFEGFYGDMGDVPVGKSLDRFPNNDGNYELGNCRWATRKEQARNRRSNHIIEYDGQRKSIAEWEESLGMKSGVVKARLRYGWSEERSLTTPVRSPSSWIR